MLWGILKWRMRIFRTQMVLVFRPEESGPVSAVGLYPESIYSRLWSASSRRSIVVSNDADTGG